MRLNFAGERILSVVAHPDDAELLCAGTLGRAAADGATVAICVMCRGDKGAAVQDSVSTVEETRRAEMTQAAGLLPATLFWGGIEDGALADAVEQRARLMTVYRQYRPTLVLTHNPDDYHADHRACHALAESVSWFACSAGHRSPEPPLAQPPALWLLDSVNMLGFEPGFYVDISDFLPLKRAMLACHRSQLNRSASEDPQSLEQLMIRQATVRGAEANVAAAEAFRLHLTWRRVAAW